VRTRKKEGRSRDSLTTLSDQGDLANSSRVSIASARMTRGKGEHRVAQLNTEKRWEKIRSYRYLLNSALFVPRVLPVQISRARQGENQRAEAARERSGVAVNE